MRGIILKSARELLPFHLVTTVHKDVAERLKNINEGLCNEVKLVLEQNKLERHIRGGMATKQKYERLRSK